MEQFRAVIKSVCIISAAVCILDGLAAGTRFRNQMKFLLNLIFITVIAAPVLQGTFDFEMPELDRYMTEDYDSAGELYQEELRRQTGENISAVLMQQLEAAGIKCTGIETDINISETNSISISSVTVSADDFGAASEIIRSSLGGDTEVINGIE